MHGLEVLASISWDPFVRGLLIVIVAFLILPGSVYLLLATNTGVRVGFMLAVAALTGWLVIMGVVWTVFGIGLPGRAPGWKLSELVTGDVKHAVSLPPDFPNGWKKLPPGDPQLADAQSAADKVLASAAAAAGEGKGGGTKSAFQPPFTNTSDYIQVSGFTKDETTVWHIRHHKITPWGHSKHVTVVQVQPVVTQPDTGGAPPKPLPDTTKPVTTVVLVRDLGSVRQPPLIITVSSLIIFGVVCYSLHRRDKQIWAARGMAAATT